MKKWATLIAVLPASQVFAQTPDVAAVQCPDGVKTFWYIFWVVTVFLAVLLLITCRALSKSGLWSLGEALSEEATKQPDPPPLKPVMEASSSRLIAFLGLLSILAIFVGIGYYALWKMFTTGEVPDLNKLTNFLYGGAVIFAPYLANQLKDAIKSFAPK